MFLTNLSPIGFPGLGIEIDPTDGFSVFGFDIKWYGVIIAFGAFLAALYGLRRVKEFGLTQDELLDGILVALPSAIVGARLYYVLFEFEHYFGPNNTWYDWMKIRDGGLAIYGGVIGAVLSLVLFLGLSKKRRRTLLPAFDLAGLGLLIGQSIGRWGNFFNREAHGGVTESFLRMSLVEHGQLQCFHPTFLYESVWNAIGFVLLHSASKKRKFDGEVFLMYLAWYGLGRAMIEGLRTDSLYLGPFRISQLLALGSCVFAVVLLICLRFFVRTDADRLLAHRLAVQEAEDEAALKAFAAMDSDKAEGSDEAEESRSLDDPDEAEAPDQPEEEY